MKLENLTIAQFTFLKLRFGKNLTNELLERIESVQYNEISYCSQEQADLINKNKIQNKLSESTEDFILDIVGNIDNFIKDGRVIFMKPTTESYKNTRKYKTYILYTAIAVVALIASGVWGFY